MTLKDRASKLATYAVLASRGRSSCAGCTTGYCCTMQRIIEISTTEATERQHLVEEKHRVRAKHELEVFEKEGHFTCPFKDPETNLCDIYEERFAVCSQYHVFNPVEDCDSRTKAGLQVLNPMMVMKTMSQDPGSHPLVMDMMLLAQGEPINILDMFKDEHE